MKLLFILLSLLLNFIIYAGPAMLWDKMARKIAPRYMVLRELQQPGAMRLALLPFLVWFILFLFDPTQKTIQQLVFLDPFLIGLVVSLLLFLLQSVDERHAANRAKWFTWLACAFAVGSFFLLNTSI